MRRINSNRNLLFEGTKSFYFLDSGGSHDSDIGLYPYMFSEDVHNSVLPISQHYSKRKNYSIVLNPPDKRIEELLLKIFVSQEGYQHSNMTEAIGDFVQEIAGLLAYWGSIYFEVNPSIKQNSNSTSDSMFAPFRLLRIHGRILKVFSSYLQIIPKQFWSESKRPFELIPSKSIWEVTIPQVLGGRKKHNQMMKSLRFASMTIPEFVNDQMSKEIKNNEPKQNLGLPEFSFNEFHQIQKLAIAGESAIWGWPIRFSLRDDTLEFYQVYRQIKFAQSMAILREYILTRLNDLILSQGLSSMLYYNDLPSYSDLKKIEIDWINGKISLEDALSSFQL